MSYQSKRILTSIALCAISIAAFALGEGRRDSLSVSASAWASVASNHQLRPLFSYSNEWGRYTLYDKGEAAACAQVAYRHAFKNPNINFSAGFTGQVSTDGDRTMLHELYADFDLWMFGVKMGMENYTPIQSNTSLAMGSYLMSNNARTIPKAWFGFLDYWSLPIGKLPWNWAKMFSDLIQIRGGASFGWMDNEGNKNYTDNALLHEKYVYGRIGQFCVKPYAGLYHSVIIGGTLSDGTKVPVDFWHSFFGKNGDPAIFGNGRFRGEVTNAAGGHQGMWDFGFDITTPFADGKVYYQQPFVDSKAQKPFNRDYGGNDFMVGILLNVKNFAPIKEVALEFMSTKWQGGESTPDPMIPNKDGGYSVFFPGDYGDVKHLKNDILRPEDVAAWEAEHGEIKNAADMYYFFLYFYNKGEAFGGRSLYLINYCLEQGWTRGNLTMGNAFMQTRETVSHYAPEGTMDYNTSVANVRIRAVNFGLRGDILPGRFSYALRVAQTRNYGNYCEEYGGSFSYEKTKNYFFAKPKNETYTKLDLNVALSRGWTVNTTWAYDNGDMYRSFAVRLGVKYQLGVL